LEKNFFEIVRKEYQKRHNFALISKRYRTIVYKREHFVTEKLFLGANLAKSLLLGENLWALRDVCTFIKLEQNRASFDAHCA
jgi:hypothetical protein